MYHILCNREKFTGRHLPVADFFFRVVMEDLWITNNYCGHDLSRQLHLPLKSKWKPTSDILLICGSWLPTWGHIRSLIIHEFSTAIPGKHVIPDTLQHLSSNNFSSVNEIYLCHAIQGIHSNMHVFFHFTAIRLNIYTFFSLITVI